MQDVEHAEFSYQKYLKIFHENSKFFFYYFVSRLLFFHVVNKLCRLKIIRSICFERKIHI